MEWKYIENLKDFVEKEVTVKGWVYHKRATGKNLRFIILRDGSGYLQAVLFKADVSEEIFTLFDNLTQETAIELTGTIRKDDRSPGGVEMGVSSIKVIGESSDYPITPKEHGTAFLLENRHLWLRSKKQHAILRVRATVVKAMRDFLDNKNFLGIESPIFTGNAAEETTTLFETKYFDRYAYLSQSGQLYAEATAMAHGKVYTYGPTFRAEKSKTRRHLTEFWMLEPEMAFYHLEEDMDLIEEMLLYVVKTTLETRKEELKVLEKDTNLLETLKAPFTRLTYTEAAKEIKAEFPDYEIGKAFGAPHEIWLAGKYEHPVFVYDFPKEQKAFYFKLTPDGKFARGVDLLAPEIGEIVGGGERETDYDRLMKEIKDFGLDEKDYKWYLDLRKYGSVPHSGFGIGIERTISWITGVHHVRETIAFPRTMNILEP